MIGLESYVQGSWQAGQGQGRAFVNPTNGDVIGTISSEGIDMAAATQFARERGVAALRDMTFAQRGGLLNAIADALIANRAGYDDIARLNSGNTKRDAAIDIDGGIGTLKYYARIGKGLGEQKYILEDGQDQLTKTGDFNMRHIWSSRPGVVICINAFNFPSWSLWEKAAVAILAGVPVVAKPASATAYLSERMVRDVVAAGAVPEGVLSLVCGSGEGLLAQVQPFDHLSFTGSAATGAMIRTHAGVQAYAPRMNIEADSVNAAVLGESASMGGEVFNLLVREAVNAVSIKAGQLCTNIRRVFVPQNYVKDFTEALAAKIDTIVCGNPASDNVRLGPLVNKAQQTAALDGLREISAEASLVRGGKAPSQVEDGDAAKGAFVEPTLFVAEKAGNLRAVHDVEVFGPAISIVPYGSMDEAIALCARGGGSLAASVWCEDASEAACMAGGLAPFHGRVMCVDPAVGKGHTGHSIVMPQGVHGGPGRAGGGEELGGARGMRFYMQRTAIQGSPQVFERLQSAAAEAKL